jgi:hypothetical protein
MTAVVGGPPSGDLVVTHPFLDRLSTPDQSRGQLHLRAWEVLMSLVDPMSSLAGDSEHFGNLGYADQVMGH